VEGLEPRLIKTLATKQIITPYLLQVKIAYLYILIINFGCQFWSRTLLMQAQIK